MTTTKPHLTPDRVIPAEDLDIFLAESASFFEEDGSSGIVPTSSGAPDYRRLSVEVSADRLTAHLEAVFPDTTMEEVLEALRTQRVVWGVQKEAIEEALSTSEKNGRRR